MVRINLVEPQKLTDEHLIAEYNEILMLIGYVKKYPQIKDKNNRDEIPKNYKLGAGHIKFFKNKLIYLKNRHEILKQEMIKRKFKPTKTINLEEFNKNLQNDWEPTKKDFKIIKERIIQKLKLKPDFYSYYGKKYDLEFYIKLLK